MGSSTVDDSTGRALLSNHGNSDHARVRSAGEYADALIDSDTISDEELVTPEEIRGEKMPHTQEQEQVEEEEKENEGHLVSQMMITAFRLGPLESPEGHFELTTTNPNIEEEEDPSNPTISDGGKVQAGEGLEKDEEPETFGRAKMLRMLDEDNVNEPVATVFIEKASFSGNTGQATIMVTSHSKEDSSDSSDENQIYPSHSIYLKVKRTTFVSEDVQTSVIHNLGGRFQSSRNVFEDNTSENIIKSEGGTNEVTRTLFEDNTGENIIKSEGGTMEISLTLFADNTGESIIKSENGTMEVSQTTFSMNEVMGDEGIVVLDENSELESDEDNCVYDGDGGDDGSGRKLQNDSCAGVVVGGECTPFGNECVDLAVSPTTNPTLSPTTSPIMSPTVSPTTAPTGSPPTTSSTVSPTTSLTLSPTASPIMSPTQSPITAPTGSPTMSPTQSPTGTPTFIPTMSPTGSPTTTPTVRPTSVPTVRPTSVPTMSPIVLNNPTTSITTTITTATSSDSGGGSRLSSGRGCGGRLKNTRGRRKKCNVKTEESQDTTRSKTAKRGKSATRTKSAKSPDDEAEEEKSKETPTSKPVKRPKVMKRPIGTKVTKRPIGRPNKVPYRQRQPRS